MHIELDLSKKMVPSKGSFGAVCLLITTTELKLRDVTYMANTAYVCDIQHEGELNCKILSVATTKYFALTLQITLDFLRHY